MKAASLWLAAFAVAAAACEGQPRTDCPKQRPVRLVYGFQNPEDLAPLDERHLVVSQLGGGSLDVPVPGSLALFDTADQSLRVLFPPPATGAAPERAAPGWGDADCPGPPDDTFSPHGIDLARHPDGTLSLLVVNHGGHASVDRFEVTGTGADTALRWRGCVPAPKGAILNDVVHLPGGGFAVTHMMDRRPEPSEVPRFVPGMETGEVFEWQPGGKLRALPGTSGGLPNGIEVSEDGRVLYVNYYGTGEVRRVERASGAVLGRTALPRPDNSSWSQDGRLLVASHTRGPAEQLACRQETPGAPCPLAFEIVALDPETLEGEVVLQHEGSPLGDATVAVELSGVLWLGSYTGEAIGYGCP